MGVSREGKIFSSRKNIFKFIHFFLLFLSCYCSCYCEARLFGNIPPSRGGGGILFGGGGGGGGGGEHDRAQVSISPIFYEQLFVPKVLLAFLNLYFVLVIFRQKVNQHKFV